MRFTSPLIYEKLIWNLLGKETLECFIMRVIRTVA